MQGNESKRISVLPPDVNNGKLLPLNIIIICTASGCFLVLATLTFALVIRNRHKKKGQITYKELGWLEPDTSNYEVPQHQLEYDVFISYSSEDIAWVKDILFQRLSDMGHQVCIDFKDFTPGMAVADNIIDAIYKSRKTIVVMSKSFLKSMWGQFELQQAHNRAVMQRQDILILVKYDNSKVPANLMGKTFLDWSDRSVQPHFWNRMYEALGAPESIDLTSIDDCANDWNSAEYEMASEKCLLVNGTPDEHASAVVETKKDTSELIKENGFSNKKTETHNTVSTKTTNSPENMCSDNNNASLNKFKTRSSFDDWITVDVCG